MDRPQIHTKYQFLNVIISSAQFFTPFFPNLGNISIFTQFFYFFIKMKKFNEKPTAIIVDEFEILLNDEKFLVELEAEKPQNCCGDKADNSNFSRSCEFELF